MRINRSGGSALGWAGIVVGGQIGSTDSVDPTGDGPFVAVPPATGPLRQATRSTWWVASNQQGDFNIDQNAPLRTAGLAAAADVTATTLPAGSTGLYIRRSDNQVYLNGLQVGHQAWKSYRNRLAVLATNGISAIHASTIFVSDGISVHFTFVVSTAQGADPSTAAAPNRGVILTGIPVELRPQQHRYYPFTAYIILPAPTGTVFHTAGDAYVSTTGTFALDSIAPPWTGGSGYIFCTGFYYVNGFDPPIAP